MFINCPYCSQLVATDPVLDLPPTHCPHCGSLLRRDHSQPDDESDDAPALDFNDLMKQQSLDDILFASATHQRGGTASEPDAMSANAERADTATVDATAENAVSRDAIAADPSIDDAFDETRRDEANQDDSASVSPSTSSSDAASARTVARRAPSFARYSSQRSRLPHDGRLIAVAAAFALLLLLQLLLADRARLASDPKWRPTLSAICGVLRCELPPWREPAAFTLLQRDVRQHPTIPGALRVSAMLRNDARWSQPWPRLHLTLSDVNGRVAGERSFEAHEYLGGTPNQSELAHGESAAVAMDIMEPAAQIVSYDFKFR